MSAIGYGCMGLSHAYGVALPKEEAIRIIRENYEMGYTYFDTAPLYTGEFADGTHADNEELVGEALKPIRDKVVISTKFGTHFDKNRQNVQDARPETIRREIESSLRKLRTDYIDLYYLHVQDVKVEPEAVAEAVTELIKEGKVRYFGLSNCSMDYIRRADAVCKVTAVQDRYSMMSRAQEKRFAELERLGIGLVPYSPLANGFLSAVYTGKEAFDPKLDFRSWMPQYTADGLRQSQALLDLLKELAQEKHATPAQLSLAWMLCKKPWIVPIPSSTKTERNRENAGAADVVLTADEIQRIDALLDSIALPAYTGQLPEELKEITGK